MKIPTLTYLRMVLGYKVLVPILLGAKVVFSQTDRRADANKVMVNIGGGVFIKRHWKNLDYSSTHYPYRLSVLDHNFDLTSGERFPFADDSVTLLYSSHTLEHIPQRFCPRLFAELHRCLKLGGVVRLTMPDYDKLYEGYRAGRTDFWTHGASPDDCLMRGLATSLVGRLDSRKLRQKFETLSKHEFADYVTGLVSIETQKADMSNHCNWWSFDKLRKMLGGAGFSEVYRSAPGESHFPEMRDRGSFLGIERLCRMQGIRGFDVQYPDKSVFVEAIK